jgi:hypothetical protein
MAVTRLPSCLISWIHSAPSGTLVPRLGMQGSNGDLSMGAKIGDGVKNANRR